LFYEGRIDCAIWEGLSDFGRKWQILGQEVCNFLWDSDDFTRFYRLAKKLEIQLCEELHNSVLTESKGSQKTLKWDASLNPQ
jgi:hypothetical protein